MGEENNEIQEKIKRYKKINRNLKIVFWVILFVVVGITSWILYRMYWSPDNAISEMKLMSHTYSNGF